MSTWTQEKIAIRLYPEAKPEYQTVQATVNGPLAYHPACDIEEKDLFTITHIPSGRALIYYLSSEYACRELIEMALASEIDWSSDMNEWRNRGPEHRAAIAKIMARADDIRFSDVAMTA